jgi:hypothetical protein
VLRDQPICAAMEDAINEVVLFDKLHAWAFRPALASRRPLYDDFSADVHDGSCHDFEVAPKESKVLPVAFNLLQAFDHGKVQRLSWSSSGAWHRAPKECPPSGAVLEDPNCLS